jgi:CRISPR-associated protein Cas2
MPRHTATQVYWICYDIADNKRLARVARAVAAVGDALHESALVCELDNEGIKALQKRIAKLIDPTVDQVRYIPLCAADRAATQHYGVSTYPALAAAWIV